DGGAVLADAELVAFRVDGNDVMDLPAPPGDADLVAVVRAAVPDGHLDVALVHSFSSLSSFFSVTLGAGDEDRRPDEVCRGGRQATRASVIKSSGWMLFSLHPPQAVVGPATGRAS